MFTIEGGSSDPGAASHRRQGRRHYSSPRSVATGNAADLREFRRSGPRLVVGVGHLLSGPSQRPIHSIGFGQS
jgi:hypothetical protein